ncbi:helix-turn-helix transcriptional regulator [Nocardioides sp. T2.26MG-1]|uniref:helix-turn-helix transcriptional regulator n=1 Tax=Nocardioides sp. T2.26MG-1 TaxID=3041166 RepID=UPI00247732A5|nr:helix-turn-helix transcriptional regulator [Nocardioides sp. T2.26MG-1]CAI9401919.1 hypothetical protein HIDPHFAB_00708 [Nocardioides sp. T2.26MG-1]
MVDEIGSASRPRSRITAESRQTVLDAAAVLQMRRSELAGRLACGEARGARVVARDVAGTQQWVRHEVPHWREVLTVRPSCSVAYLRKTLPDNRELVTKGLRMVSLWHLDSLKPEARRLLAGERVGRYLFGVGPVQMNLVDRRFVLLHGPFFEGIPSLMEVTAPECLDAAWRYWHAAVASSYPANEDEAEELDSLTPRQRQVAALLGVDTRDESIAETLGVSVRTVRSDIAQLMEVLGVRSRFAAGVRFREMVDDR